MRPHALLTCALSQSLHVCLCVCVFLVCLSVCLSPPFSVSVSVSVDIYLCLLSLSLCSLCRLCLCLCLGVIRQTAHQQSQDRAKQGAFDAPSLPAPSPPTHMPSHDRAYLFPSWVHAASRLRSPPLKRQQSQGHTHTHTLSMPADVASMRSLGAALFLSLSLSRQQTWLARVFGVRQAD